jgi:hypothetical protein
MNRDWVDYGNLLFNGLSVLVAAAGLIVAIVSLLVARAADREAKAAKAAEARTRRHLEEALTVLIRQFEVQSAEARAPELPLPGLRAEDADHEPEKPRAATSTALAEVLRSLRTDGPPN